MSDLGERGGGCEQKPVSANQSNPISTVKAEGRQRKIPGRGSSGDADGPKKRRGGHIIHGKQAGRLYDWIGEAFSLPSSQVLI